MSGIWYTAALAVKSEWLFIKTLDLLQDTRHSCPQGRCQWPWDSRQVRAGSQPGSRHSPSPIRNPTHWKRRPPERPRCSAGPYLDVANSAGTTHHLQSLLD